MQAAQYQIKNPTTGVEFTYMSLTHAAQLATGPVLELRKIKASAQIPSGSEFHFKKVSPGSNNPVDSRFTQNSIYVATKWSNDLIIDDYRELETAVKPGLVQNFLGPVQNVAGRDIVNLTVYQFL